LLFSQMVYPVLTVLAMCIGVSMTQRGRTEESFVYGCSGGRAPLVSTGQGTQVAVGQARYSHEGRWPGCLGSNSTRYSSHKSFTYGETSVFCRNIQTATDQVRVVEGRRVCLTCEENVPVGRWWWLRKLSPDMRDQSSHWERLDNDTYRTITGSPGGITVCWDKWWASDQGIYLCLRGSARACPLGALITFIRWWQNPGNGINWNRSGKGCVIPDKG